MRLQFPDEIFTMYVASVVCLHLIEASQVRLMEVIAQMYIKALCFECD